MTMRRELRFKSFNDVKEELARLGQGPVETTGNWSYFQILTHCATSLENCMKGLKRDMSWWKRHVSGPRAYRKAVAAGFMPAGVGAQPGKPVERIEGDEKAALERLLKAMDNFEKFEGKLSEHPRMGLLNKEQWRLIIAIHMANHLGNARLKT